LTLIQEKLNPQWHKPCTIENFWRPHTCYARDEVADLLNDKRLQLEFSKQSLASMSFFG